MAWLEQAFGFTTTVAVEDPNGDPAMSHYEMAYAGAGRVMVGGEWTATVRSPTAVGGANTASVYVLVPGQLDAHCEHARQAGAVIAVEPADEPHGERVYRAVDPEGHLWTFAMPLEDG